MPKFESELRSRDFEQMIAEMTITEDPPPEEVGVDFPVIASQSDTHYFNR